MRKIKALFAEDQSYFANCKAFIAEQNNRMLFDSCIVYGLVLAFYTVLSIVMGQSSFLVNMYYVFDGIHLALCACVFTRSAKRKSSFRWTQTLCMLLELTFLSFFALEGALVSPTQHSLYVPIAILLVQVVFIHKIGCSMLVIFLYTASYALLSCCYKVPEAYGNDVLIALATFLSANIACLLIAKLRRSERQALTKYEQLSMRDMLTGLYNKRAMERLCQPLVSEPGRPCTLLMLDLDDFKQINDRNGHAVGDEVLHSVGAAVQTVFRAADIKARFGGDEFVVLMDGCEDAQAVRQRLNALRGQIEGHVFSVPALTVPYCVGVAFKREGDTFQSMLVRADQALYLAKSSGKDRIEMERPAGQAAADGSYTEAQGLE